MTLHLRPSDGEDTPNSQFRDKPDGNADPAGETGWFLQRERERRGKTLADAALETRINAKYLQSIEYGVLQDLPNRSYVLGYIRVYAEFLGLEADPLVEHYKGLLPDQDSYRNKAARIGFASVATLSAAAAVFVIGLTVTIWLFMPDSIGPGAQQTADLDADDRVRQTSDTDRLPTGSIRREQEARPDPADIEAQKLDEAVPTVKVKQRGFTDIDDRTLPTESAETLQATDKTALNDNAPGAQDTDSLTDFIRQHVSETQATEETPAAAPKGNVFGSENASSRLVLTANQTVWIRIEDEKGNVILTRTLEAGDAYRVPDRKGLVLIARDGGALDYSIDGRTKGSIGASGEIVVGRSLDIDKLAKVGS